MHMEMKLLERKIRGYWYRDGIGEIAGGFIFLLLGTYFGVTEYLGDDSFWGGLLQAGLIIVLLGLMYIGRRLVHALKTMFVYPRTGFFQYRENEDIRSHRNIVAAVVAGLTAAILVAASTILKLENWTPGLTGVLGALILSFIGRKASSLVRFLIMGIISIILGIVLSLVNLPMGYALGLYYGMMGLVFIASGILVLGAYLRENPQPVEGSRE